MSFPVSPAKVAWLVIAVAILAVECKTFFAEVLKLADLVVERKKIVNPRSIHCDVAPAVICIVLAVWIKTAFFDVVPRIVNFAFGHAVSLPAQATATLRAPAC